MRAARTAARHCRVAAACAAGIDSAERQIHEQRGVRPGTIEVRVAYGGPISRPRGLNSAEEIRNYSYRRSVPCEYVQPRNWDVRKNDYLDLVDSLTVKKL